MDVFGKCLETIETTAGENFEALSKAEADVATLKASNKALLDRLLSFCTYVVSFSTWCSNVQGLVCCLIVFLFYFILFLPLFHYYRYSICFVFVMFLVVARDRPFEKLRWVPAHRCSVHSFKLYYVYVMQRRNDRKVIH